MTLTKEVTQSGYQEPLFQMVYSHTRLDYLMVKLSEDMLTIYAHNMPIVFQYLVTVAYPKFL